MTKEKLIGFGFIFFLFSADINIAEGQGSAVTVGDLLREVPNAVVVPCVRGLCSRIASITARRECG